MENYQEMQWGTPTPDIKSIYAALLERKGMKERNRGRDYIVLVGQNSEKPSGLELQNPEARFHGGVQGSRKVLGDKLTKHLGTIARHKLLCPPVV